MENEISTKIKKYLDKIEVQIQEAKAIKESKEVFSDTTDSEGNQYVNLVQEGGSVLGLAHVGYTYILETAGIRFWKLAGTSAGAINAILLAAIDNKSDIKSEKILGYIAEKNFVEFVDGPKWLPDVLKKSASNSGYMLNLVIFMMGIFMLTVINLIFLSIYHTPIYAKFVYFLLVVSLVLTLILLSIWFLFKKLHWGINPGNDFRKWMHNILTRNNAETLEKLKKKSLFECGKLKLEISK
ncbi:MAG: patatin-like phospholipase family protein [Saprospiraceae bacterium]|nr:patatin-like phospholipase family protein [Saprospiraceae bacterium]